MLGALIPRMSVQVSSRIEKLGLSPKEVAREANVSVCFIMDMTCLSTEEWRRLRIRLQLLRVLKVLSLHNESNRVKKVMGYGTRRKSNRVKFDRRQGGKILARGRI